MNGVHCVLQNTSIFQTLRSSFAWVFGSSRNDSIFVEKHTYNYFLNCASVTRLVQNNHSSLPEWQMAIQYLAWAKTTSRIPHGFEEYTRQNSLLKISTTCSEHTCVNQAAQEEGGAVLQQEVQFNLTPTPQKTNNYLS